MSSPPDPNPVAKNNTPTAAAATTDGAQVGRRPSVKIATSPVRKQSPSHDTDAEDGHEAEDVVPNDLPRTSTSSDPKAAAVNGHGRSTSLGYTNSVAKRSTFTNVDGETVSGSAFINGAGTTGPSTTAENQDLHLRAASADVSLTPEQKSRIVKSEAKDNKQLSKIIKGEAKVEKQAFGSALAELASLQKLQKAAVQREAKTNASHSKIMTAHQKNEAAFLAARTKYEVSQAQLNSETEALEISRANARDLTQRMQEKSQEVDALRQMYGVDEREREVKLVELTGKPSHKRWSLLK